MRDVASELDEEEEEVMGRLLDVREIGAELDAEVTGAELNAEVIGAELNAEVVIGAELYGEPGNGWELKRDVVVLESFAPPPVCAVSGGLWYCELNSSPKYVVAMTRAGNRSLRAISFFIHSILH